MDSKIQERINEWLGNDFDAATRAEIQALIDKKDEKELSDRFYMDLEFGTGGLRGVLGAGSNRMNIYTVRRATQGLANYILRAGGREKGILVGRDSRINSDIFALEAAGVLAANGIKVYFFEDIHPTPAVSFGIRHLGCIAGIMVTASHNPKEYNGYKVFWDDGAQVTSPADTDIITEVRKIEKNSQVKTMNADELKKCGLFQVVDSILDPVYINQVAGLSIHPEVIASSGVRICYTPLYGTGYKLVPASLIKYGFKDVVLVEEQSTPDGSFPTAPFPNPEEKEAMSLGMKRAAEKNCDVLIATDPDADRVGVALKKDDGSYYLLNGNQIATLLVYYIITEKKANNTMPSNPFIVKTIVTTDLISRIARKEGMGQSEVLTGFKWIGLAIRGYETEKTADRKNFIFGCEESHGYLAGDFVRDKDAVQAASLIAELIAFYRSRGTSAYAVLERIYLEYGYFAESQKSVTMKGMDGAAEIKALMERLRTSAPVKVGKWNVLSMADLNTGVIRDPASGKETGRWDLPKSNVVVLKLSEGAKVVARPSGTEPKIKFYFTNMSEPAAGESAAELIKRVENEHQELRAAFLSALNLG